MGDPGCCFENACEAPGWEASAVPQPSPLPALVLSRMAACLAGAVGGWCLVPFSVPPPLYAFLIFKAIIGLSDKILSNQTLSSGLMLWLPSGRKSWWEQRGQAGARGPCCWRKLVPVQRLPGRLPLPSLRQPLQPPGSAWSGWSRRSMPADPAFKAKCSLRGCSIPFADDEEKLLGHFLKGEKKGVISC